ncbi:hypothetical protein DBT_2067 [Dissulfuribacter thermophilus]|uniref:Methionine synthase II (Cobalamin-independent) n=2 Tax=Dissulfuribacter thermophilus TaxID=1156395 RepID=A0A1B9F3X6_9BACT|nr:hypothetical protein DBT_2067 [Dissulfuribacter thermophilus]
MTMKSSTNFNPQAHATLIGSLPFEDHDNAQDVVLKYIDQIPIWVQLPCYPQERLLTQFTEGFPGLRQSDDTVYFDPNAEDFEAEFLQFFEEFLAVKEGAKSIEESVFALSKDRGKGFYCFLEKVRSMDPKPYALKGQITGPFTLLTGIKDKDGKFAFYNPQLREAIVQGLSLKAAFQAKKLKELSPHAIVFLDEPALAGFGSSTMVGISASEVQKDLKISIDAIHDEGALCGVHVCANTEWSLLLDPSLELDIISFDAFDYLDRFLIYKDKILNFIKKGGIIAWGFVPTQKEEEILSATPDSLMERYEEVLRELGITKEEFLNSSLITPSCGTGLLSKELSEKVLSLTRDLSQKIRDLS